MIERGSDWPGRESVSTWMCIARKFCGFSLQISVVLITTNELSLSAHFVRVFFFSFCFVNLEKQGWIIYPVPCWTILEEPDIKPWKPQTFYSKDLHVFTRWHGCPHRRVVGSPVSCCSVERLEHRGHKLWAQGLWAWPWHSWLCRSSVLRDSTSGHPCLALLGWGAHVFLIRTVLKIETECLCNM